LILAGYEEVTDMLKESQDKLHINMLGGMSLRYKDKSINDQANRSRKLWVLLSYVITFRDKELSQNDFIELLWPNDESTNPGNALKTLLHRVRAMLNNLEYLNGHQIIIQDNGTYAWNNKLPITLDVDDFEKMYRKGNDAEDEEQRLAYYLQALDLYKGDFLPKLVTETWVVPINTYYHSLYLRMIHEVLAALMEKKNYDEIVRRCNLALAIEPYDEFLYYNLILALVRLGNQQAALNQYEKMTELFFNRFGVTHSEELTALYKEVVRTTNSMETDLSVIKRYLQEQEVLPGAFYCEYEFFKNIYQLQARALARSGQAIYVGLITLTNGSGGKLTAKILSNAMTKLNDCIRLSLRQGDVYSKYSLSQYIIMLPSANYENSRLVMARVAGRFRKENPHSQAIVKYTLHPLEPLAFNTEKETSEQVIV
jgi:DNA-binding SARP family transcriptional activator